MYSRNPALGQGLQPDKALARVLSILHHPAFLEKQRAWMVLGPLLRCMRALSGVTGPRGPHLVRGECARWRVHRLPMGPLLRHAWMGCHELLLGGWEAGAWLVAGHGSGVGVGVRAGSSLGVRGVIRGRLLHGMRLRHGLVGGLGLGWGVLGAGVGGVEGLRVVWGVLRVHLGVLGRGGVLRVRLGVRLGVAGVLCGAMWLLVGLVRTQLVMGLSLGLGLVMGLSLGSGLRLGSRTCRDFRV